MDIHRVRIINDVSDYKDNNNDPIVFIEIKQDVFLEINRIPDNHDQIHQLLNKIDNEIGIPITWHNRAFYLYSSFVNKWIESDPIE